MLDDRLRPYIDPPVRWLGAGLVRLGVSANLVTWLGFFLGCVAALLICFEHYYWGLAFILLSRLCDGLDGAVARASGGGTDYGGFLDIVLDFAFYGMIPLAFIIADPANNALAGSLLLLTFYINGASFLAFSVMAERRGIESSDSSTPNKSIFFSVGLAEASETLIAFTLFSVLSDWFSIIAYIFSVLVILTTASRVHSARHTFGGDGE